MPVLVTASATAVLTGVARLLRWERGLSCSRLDWSRLDWRAALHTPLITSQPTVFQAACGGVELLLCCYCPTSTHVLMKLFRMEGLLVREE